MVTKHQKIGPFGLGQRPEGGNKRPQRVADAIRQEISLLLVGKINDPLDARRNKNLPSAATEDIRLRAGTQSRIESLGEGLGAYA